MYGDVTEDELVHLPVLIERVNNEIKDINTINWKFSDRAYLRSYRGRRGNIDDSVSYLKNDILWRIEKTIDSIQPSDCEPFWSKKLTFLHKTDLEGRPVLYCVVKRHNKDDRAIEQVEKSIIYLIESAIKLSKPDEEKVVVVFDLKDFSYKNMDFEAVKLLVTILQAHYEEILKHALIINSPFIFSACWAVIKPWLDPITAAKVQFIKAKKLIEYVPRENIPIDEIFIDGL